MLQVTYLLVDSSLTLDNSPVFQSQTIDWLKVLRASGTQVGLVCTVQNYLRFEEVAAEFLRDCQVPFTTIPHRGLVNNLVSGALAMRRFNRMYPSLNIYARGIWGSLTHWMAFPIGGPTLIYDFRGDLIAEASARRNRPIQQLLLRRLTRRAIRHADQLLCISHPAAELLAREYGRTGATVIPSSVDCGRFHEAQTQREAIRKNLGVGENELLLVYSGGLNRYQMVPEMLRLWASLVKTAGVHFLLLSNQQPIAGQFSGLGGMTAPENLIVKSVAREEVPAFLAASDVGFLLRQDDPVNHVASPVKFGEYLASGLAVVTSPKLGDVSQLVVERNLGILVSPEDIEESVGLTSKFLNVVIQDREGYRNRSQQAAAELFDWSTQIATWRQLLGEPELQTARTHQRS